MAKYFYEPFPHFFIQVLDLLYKGNLFDFFIGIYAHFQVNFLAYFENYRDIVYFSLKYSIVILTIYFAIDAIVRGNKLHAAISIIGITNLMFLLIVNDANDWREIRAMSPVFYFYCLFIAVSKNEWLKIGILAITIFLFVNSIPVMQTRVAERNRLSDSNVVAEKQAEMFKMLGKINKEEALIRLDFVPSDYSYDLLQLPIKNELNEPIRYIVPYYTVPQARAYYALKRQGTTFELVKEP